MYISLVSQALGLDCTWKAHTDQGSVDPSGRANQIKALNTHDVHCKTLHHVHV